MRVGGTFIENNTTDNLYVDDFTDFKALEKIHGSSVYSKNIKNQTEQKGYGWGPERTIYTREKPADILTFNSNIDNPVIGDERRFVRVKNVRSGEIFQDEILIEPGETYEVSISFFVSSFCKNLRAPLLTNSRIGVDMSEKISADNPGGIRVVLSADNEPNEKMWDGIQFTTNSKKDVQIKFLPASAFLKTLGLPNGEMLSDKALFKKDGYRGHLIGYKKLIGNTAFGLGHSGCITYRFTALQPKVTLRQDIIEDNKLIPEKNLHKGERATLQITFNNVGKTIIRNTGFRVELSKGLSLVPGTTRLYSNLYTDGLQLKDCLHTNSALTGAYHPGTYAKIIYTVEVNSDFNGQELSSNAYLFYDEKGFAGAKTYLHKDENAVRKLKYNNGDIYVGTVKNGLPHGKGVLTTKGGLRYEGTFVDGKINGKFICKDKSGSRFENYVMGEQIFD